MAKQYTEIIYALGAEDGLVAVDLTSTYPPAATQLPNVGYHRALSIEAILAAKPTLVIHDNNIGPEAVVQQLNNLKIRNKVFETQGKDIETTQALIREMGDYFQKQEQAHLLCEQLGQDMEKALENLKNYPDRPKVLIIHFGQAMNTYLTITQAHTGGQMIAWAGGKIPVAGSRGMLPLSPEVVSSCDPDVILMTSFGYDRLGSLEEIKGLPGVSTTKAAKNNRIYRVEEHDLVYVGPRTGENVLALQKLIHETP
jgi:iron complex transport system substrate-binding protein